MLQAFIKSNKPNIFKKLEVCHQIKEARTTKVKKLAKEIQKKDYHQAEGQEMGQG